MPVLNALLSGAEKVTTPLGLGAFSLVVVVAVLWVTGQRRTSRPIPSSVWAVICFGIAVPIGSTVVTECAPEKLYEIEVTVLDPSGLVVRGAVVTTNVGHRVSQSTDGYQIEIAPANVPPNRTVEVTADLPDAFLHGSEEIQLANHRHPAVTVRLAPLPQGTARGLVRDPKGAGLDDVFISVVGHASEAAVTKSRGAFSLPAHVPPGKRVMLHAEKDGYKPIQGYYLIGDDPIVITLRTP